MATTMKDAKISVRIDTEEARTVISQLEKQIEKGAQNAENREKQVQDVENKSLAKADGAIQQARDMGSKFGFKVPDLVQAATDVTAAVAGVVARGVFEIVSGGPVGLLIPGMGTARNAVQKATELGIKKAAPWVEFGSQFAVGFGTEAIESAGLNDVPFAADATGAMVKALDNLQHQMQALRTKQDALTAMFDNTGTAIKAQLGLEIPLDKNFLGKVMATEFKLSEAQSQMKYAIKDAVMHTFGTTLAKTTKKYIQ